MGISDYGCAVTGVSIERDEEVLHVVVIDKKVEGLYGIRQKLSEYFKELKYGVVVSVGDLTPREVAVVRKMSAKRDLGKHLMINFGTCNQYRWIWEIERQDADQPLPPNFMVKRSAAKVIARADGVTDLDDPVVVLNSVARLISLCRINPFATLSDHKNFDATEYRAHVQRIELIKNALGEKYERQMNKLRAMEDN